MGQSYLLANLDKKEFIDPHGLGDGSKLWEFAFRDHGPTNVAIALLLAKRSTFSGADLELVGGRAGSWCGNRIAIVGLYDDPLPGRKENLFEVITGMGSEGYANISIEVVEMVRAYLGAFKSPKDP
jgi:hypothetical protein